MEVLMSSLRDEAHSRSLAKAVTWRFTATIDTFITFCVVPRMTFNRQVAGPVLQAIFEAFASGLTEGTFRSPLPVYACQSQSAA
jgi:hypothetical protein